MTKILLVEDDASLGATLKERLERENYAVALATSKAEAELRGNAETFDLYIFDVGLPDGTGFELARELPPKPLIFMTAQSDAESRLQGYELGAEEYVPKPFHLRELLLRVRHVLDNHVSVPRFEHGDVRVDFESLKVERAGHDESVPHKDLQLFKLLIERSPKVVSRDQALDLLWGEDKFPSTRTVDNAVLRLRGALGPEVSAAIESVRGVGYRWNPAMLEAKPQEKK